MKSRHTHKRTSASRGNNLVPRLYDQGIFLKTAQVAYIFTHIIMKANINCLGLYSIQGQSGSQCYIMQPKEAH